MVNQKYYLEEFYAEERSINYEEPVAVFRGWDIYKNDSVNIWLVGRFNTLEEAQQQLDRYINEEPNKHN